MLESEILLLGVLAMLVAYLCVSIGLRHRAERSRQKPWPVDWQHQGFNPEPLSPRMRELRRDYVSAVRARPSHSWHHQGLLAQARQAVIRFAYFRAGVAADSRSSTAQIESQ
jgi:hypothetical protein